MKLFKHILLIFNLLLCFPVCAQWQQTTLPDTLGKIWELKTLNSQLFAGTEAEGVWVSNDNGDTWTQKNSGLGFQSAGNIEVRALGELGNKIFSGTISDSGIYSTVNSGSTWNSANHGYFSGTGRFIDAFGTLKHKIYAASQGNGVYVSSDSGNIWNTMNAGFYPPGIPTQWRQAAFAVIDTFIFASKGYRSSLNSQQWIFMNPPDGGFNWILSSNNSLYGISLGLYRSNDFGTTWDTLISDNPILTAGGVIRCLAKNSNDFFAGNQDGIFRFTLNDTIWININDNLPVDYWVFRILVNDGYLFVCGVDGTVWRRPVSEVTGLKEIKQKKNILNIYPNPFDSSVTIESEYENLEKVKLEFNLYDTTGKMVRRFKMNQAKIKMDKGNLKSGIYLYKVFDKKEIISSGRIVIQ